MDNHEALELFLDQMLDNAVNGFQAGEQYDLLREKLEHMELDCQGMLNKDQQRFAEECFDLLLDVSGRQELYVYRQGLKDGVALLKELQVLA